MIERGGKLAVKRQAQLLVFSRSSVYYRSRPVSARDLKLMRRIDELHLEVPFFGARKIAAQLRREGQSVRGYRCSGMGPNLLSEGTVAAPLIDTAAG